MARVPIAQNLAALNDDDRTLLHVLYLLRYLRVYQVLELCYPDKTEAYVQQRLWRLSQRGLIAAVKLREFTSTVAYWHLDALGLRAIETILEVERRTPLRDFTVSAVYVRHYAQIGDVYLALATNGTDFTWLNSRHGHRYDANALFRAKPGKVYPDATVAPAGVGTVYLEVDRASMSLATMQDKFQKYSLLFDRLAVEVDYRNYRWSPALDIGHYLLVLCPGTLRARHLQELINREGLPGRVCLPDEAAGALLGMRHWWASTRARRQTGN